MKFKAVTMSGVTADIEVDTLSVTVEEVKKMIYAKNDSIPVESMGLILGGKRLNDEQTLSDVGLSEGGIVHIVRRLKSMNALQAAHVEMQQKKETLQPAQAQSSKPVVQGMLVSSPQAGVGAVVSSPHPGTTSVVSKCVAPAPVPAPVLTPAPVLAPAPVRAPAHTYTAHTAAPPTMMSVVVPAGGYPGQRLQVRTGDGRLITVVVPLGCTAGHTFQFQVPAMQRRRLLVTCPRHAQQGGLMQVCPFSVYTFGRSFLRYVPLHEHVKKLTVRFASSKA